MAVTADDMQAAAAHFSAAIAIRDASNLQHASGGVTGTSEVGSVTL